MKTTYAVFLVGITLVLTATTAAHATPDPTNDRLGWENGYWHNESIDIGTGPSKTELERMVARSMARVEYLRGKEFTRDVQVNQRTRSELQSNSSRSNLSSEETNLSEWNNQVWEALFIVGEESDVSQEIGSTLGESVGGVYTGENISVVTEDDTLPNEVVIAHELVHLLQDQHYNLSAERFQGRVQDEQLGISGLLEGEAGYIEDQYMQKCGGEWDCVQGSSRRGAGRTNRSNINLGVFVTIYNPYSDGPPYIHSLVETGGWGAVEDKFDEPPTTSETIIHHTNYPGRDLEFNDTSNEGWVLWRDQGINGYDSVGEASIYALFWYQASRYDVPVIDPSSFVEAEGIYDTYNYVSQPSEGWGNDRIYPYRNGSKRGYVWKTVWDTQRDAGEFYQAYIEVLRGHNAERVNQSAWRIPEGPFEDAFSVRRNNHTVTIVNAPSVKALTQIRANASKPSGQAAPQPGFGLGVTLLALLILISVWRLIPS